jgi:GNAT superfamily N-acetyltransferase
VFKNHHYLTSKLPPSTRTFLATADFGEGETIVGFVASMTMYGQIKNAWRESRAVILPDFQGLGIGPRMSNAVAQIHIDDGKRYFSKTAHPRFGQYRQSHPELWRPTSKNLVSRVEDRKAKQRRLGDSNEKDHKRIESGQSHAYDISRFNKLCYSHEYIGAKDTGGT